MQIVYFLEIAKSIFEKHVHFMQSTLHTKYPLLIYEVYTATCTVYMAIYTVYIAIYTICMAIYTVFMAIYIVNMAIFI